MLNKHIGFSLVYWCSLSLCYEFNWIHHYLCPLQLWMIRNYLIFIGKVEVHLYEKDKKCINTWETLISAPVSASRPSCIYKRWGVNISRSPNIHNQMQPKCLFFFKLALLYDQKFNFGCNFHSNPLVSPRSNQFIIKIQIF